MTGTPPTLFRTLREGWRRLSGSRWARWAERLLLLLLFAYLAHRLWPQLSAWTGIAPGAARAPEIRVTYAVAMADPGIRRAFGGVQGIPTTFLIDRSGVIRHRVYGFFAPPALEAAVARMLEAPCRGPRDAARGVHGDPSRPSLRSGNPDAVRRSSSGSSDSSHPPVR